MVFRLSLQSLYLETLGFGGRRGDHFSTGRSG